MRDSVRGAITAAAIAAAASMVAGCAESETGGPLRAVDAAESRDATGARTAPEAPSDDRYLPRFTEDGRLLRPENWETWVLAGTSMGLTYTENPRQFAPGEAPGSFLQVYVQPWAYETFMDEGEFPEGTMFILAGSRPVSKADPARGGFYQGDLHLMEVHLKQDGIDPTGWAFFGYGADAEAADKVPGDASCYSCHADNADHDHVFVQFYPRIRERLGMAEPARASGAEMPASPAEGAASAAEGGE